MSEKKRQTQPEDIHQISDRLNELKKLVEKTSVRKTAKPVGIGRMMWLAFNVISDLIAGVACGLLIGYGLDSLLGTRPIFIAIFLIMGCIAGLLNAVWFLKRYDEKQRLKSTQSSEEE